MNTIQPIIFGATPPIEDLDTQLESLLDAVWRAERNWTFDDRLALAGDGEQS